MRVFSGGPLRLKGDTAPVFDSPRGDGQVLARQRLGGPEGAG